MTVVSWMPVHMGQPKYGTPVILTLNHIQNKAVTVAMGHRDLTNQFGDKYVIQGWSSDHEAWALRTDVDQYVDVWYVTAWAPKPTAYKT